MTIRAHLLRRVLVLAASLVVAGTVLPAQALAAHHLMVVNEVMTSYGGNPNAQFIEILDPFNEPFPATPYRLVVYDANGVRLGAHDLGGDAQIVDNNVPMLISTPAADVALGSTGDQALSVPLPVGAGQISFTTGTGETKIHTLTYGCISNPVTGGTRDAGPQPLDGQSTQRQGAGAAPPQSVTRGTPTPKSANTAGTAAPACDPYDKPISASPIRVPLVPAFGGCTSANSTHGLPLQLPVLQPALAIVRAR